MALLRNFKGNTAIIRDDETGELIAETEVLDYDQVLVVMTVNSRPFEHHNYGRVSLLILCDTEIFEFSGNVRRISIPGRISIALFKGRVKEDRSSKRYTINAPAVIESLIVDGAVLPLATPERVTVVNVSTDGVLVRTPPNILEMPALFQLKMTIGNQETIINNCVVRTHCATPEYVEFGCKFLSAMPAK